MENIDNNNLKDNLSKFQSNTSTIYINNYIFIFLFTLSSNLDLNKKSNVKIFSITLYIFDYLHLNLGNMDKKTDNKLNDNLFFSKNYLKNNQINYHYSSKINTYLNNEYINNKKYLNCWMKYFISIFFDGIKYIKNIKIIKKCNKIAFNKNTNKRFFYCHFLLYILLIIININAIKAYQEINITINGTGKQKIVDNDTKYYNYKPNEILINGILQNYTDYYVYNLTENINIITMRWYNKLPVCSFMFYYLPNITDFNFLNFDTSQVENMTGMFFNLNSIVTLDLSNFNTSSVKDMAYMFSYCTSLVSLNLKNFDTSNVENMNDMFQNLKSLKTIDLSSFNTSSVKDMHYMFYGCSSLVSLNLRTFNTSKVKYMNGMFYYASLLKTLDLSNFITSSVIDMKSMFGRCSSLVSLNLINLHTSKVINMSLMFSNSISLKILDLSNFDTSSVITMKQMFDGCSSLVSLNLNNFDTSRVTDFSWMFDGCNSLIYLNLYSFTIKNNVIINSGMLPGSSVNLLLCYNTATANILKNYLNGHSNKCQNKCFKDEAKLIVDNRTCINDCNDDNIYKYEYKNICFKNCSISEYLYGSSDYEIYYNYNKTKCIDKIPDGYYLTDINDKTIDKCNIKCETCNYESNINDLCLSCNNKNNYYLITNNNSNTNLYINCFNFTPSGYAFDKYSLSYKPCYPTCKECKKIGDNYNHQCLSCIDGHYLNDTNCYKNCSYYYYFDDLHTHHCTEAQNCPENKSKLITEKGECVDDCSKENIYKYEYNNRCFKTCLEPEILGLNEENEIYYNYNKTKCVNTIPDGYFLNDTNNKTIDKCNINCKTCNKESNTNNLCISCNIENNYYPIVNNFTTNNYIYCSNYTPSGFVAINFTYTPCYLTCKECKNIGDNYNHQCLSCIHNLYLNDTNCITTCPYYYYFDDLNDGHCTKERICPENKSKLIIEKGECIKNCSKDSIYKYEYNDRCYNYENITYITNNITQEKTEIQSENTENTIFSIIDTTHELFEKSSESAILNIITNQENFVKRTESTTSNINDISQENIEKSSESEVFIINYYLEGNIIFNEDNDNIIENLINKLNNSYIKQKQLEDIKNGNNLILIENNELKISLISSDNKNNKNINQSIIDLGECENKLKEFYNISKNESLLILKVEVLKKDMKKPRIEYEVYYPSNENILYKLDLNICQDINILIYSPMKLYDKNINVDIYNSSSDFYKDICYEYSTENGTDIILNDRKEEYINKDLNPCEENCNFTEYDFENNRAICSCEIKKEIKTYSEININKTLLYQSFNNVKNIINLNVMKCYNKLFCKSGILYNIGSYIVLSTIMLYFITIIIFHLKEYTIFKNLIENIKYKRKNFKKENINKKSNKKELNSNMGKNSYKKMKKRNKFIKHIKIKEEPPKKKNIKKKIINKNYSINLVQTTNIGHNFSKDLKENNKMIINRSDKLIEKNTSENNIKELNDLEYSEALKKDKRNFLQYYISLLEMKHILFFSFCKTNDYNSRIIKIFLFFYSFIIYLFVNTLFFNDSTMHKIYVDIGIYNFIYQLPQIIYSSLISIVLNVIIKSLALIESNLIDLKNFEKDIEKKKNELIKYYFYKIFIFFIVSLLLLLFFWYYISCFCVIYFNTQIHLITDTTISFALSMIYPLLIYLLTGLLRMISLRANNKSRKFLYYLSYILQFF